jgi:hypothetical protein
MVIGNPISSFLHRSQLGKNNRDFAYGYKKRRAEILTKLQKKSQKREFCWKDIAKSRFAAFWYWVSVVFLTCYHLLKPETGNLIFLYDQPGEHVVTAILVNDLPQKNLDTLLLETAQVLRFISLFQPRRQLGADLCKRLFCDSRFQGRRGIGDQNVKVVCDNRRQERI